MIKNVTFLRLKKVDGSRFFWSNFVRFWVYRTPLGFIEKQAPQKALCLGPDPPPWEFIEKSRFLLIFTENRAFNRAGKTVSKIGIYALPPLKSEIYRLLNNSRPNLSDECVFGIVLELFSYYFGPWYCFFTLPFFGSQSNWLL
jgi:hypothetical protein